MNIQKLLQDVFLQIVILQNIKKKINAYIVSQDFLKQMKNHVFIVRQEKMEDQIVKNVNILNMKMELIQIKLIAKNVKKIVFKPQMEDVLIVLMKLVMDVKLVE